MDHWLFTVETMGVRGKKEAKSKYIKKIEERARERIERDMAAWRAVWGGREKPVGVERSPRKRGAENGEVWNEQLGT